MDAADLSYAKMISRMKLKNLPEGFTDLHALAYGQGDPRNVAVALSIDQYKNLLNDQDATGMTPLMYAAKQLHGDIIKELIEAGAVKDLKSKSGETALEIFEEAYNSNQEELTDAAAASIRRMLRVGGRRRKTRSRKTRRRQTRRKW